MPSGSSWSTSATSARPAATLPPAGNRPGLLFDQLGEGLDWIRDDINALPPQVLTIVGGRTATEESALLAGGLPESGCRRLWRRRAGDRRDRRGRPWSEVAGLVYRGDDGRLVHNPPRANAPLDDDLMPARDLRRHPYYLTSKGVSTGIKVDQIAGSRGCPFHCKFCSFSINPWGVKRCWTPRSAESIVREIDRDRRRRDLLRGRRVHASAGAGRRDLRPADRPGIRKNYVVNARSEIANRPDILRKMEQAGFVALLIGVESTQDATLKSMGKGVTIEQIRQRFAVLRKSTMIINAYFIVGNIGETEEQMLSIAPFARSIGVDLIHVSRLRSEPYSGLSELVAQTPGYHVDAEGFVYSDRYSSRHIADLRKRIDRQFYSPRHVARRGAQAAAGRATAGAGQGGTDDPRLSRPSIRHPGRPESAQVAGRTGKFSPRPNRRDAPSSSFIFDRRPTPSTG